MNEIDTLIPPASAERQIRKIQESELRRILSPIASRSHIPVGATNTYGIRIGNYRVLYQIDGPIRVVEVSGVKYRRETYD
jgi:mRNA interferase RelE/StbE